MDWSLPWIIIIMLIVIIIMIMDHYRLVTLSNLSNNYTSYNSIILNGN